MRVSDTKRAIAFFIASILAMLALTGPCAVAGETWVAAVGMLRTGVVAIGGETTGTTITRDEITWELDFGKNQTLSDIAQRLSGKQVMVQGKLEHRQGVEIKERSVVTVTALQATDESTLRGLSEFGFRTTVGREHTEVQVSPTKNETIFEIHSPFGIDAATIERLTSEWPPTMIVRLHLRGLESFQVRNADVTIQWSVSSSGGNASRVSLQRDKTETPISEGDPYHSAVQIVGGKVPVKDGYFEVKLPEKFFEGNPSEIHLRWIDFYRN